MKRKSVVRDKKYLGSLCGLLILSLIAFCGFSALSAPLPDDPPKLEIVTKSIRDAIADANYVSAAFEATGGKFPLTWTATGLPDGVSFGDSDIIHGKATQAGSFPVVVTVTDNTKPKPATATANFTLKVLPKGSK